MSLTPTPQKVRITDADFPGRGVMMSVLIAIDGARQKIEGSRQLLRQALFQVQNMAPDSNYLELLIQLDSRFENVASTRVYQQECYRVAAAKESYRCVDVPNPQFIAGPLGPVLPYDPDQVVVIYGCRPYPAMRYAAVMAKAFCLHSYTDKPVRTIDHNGPRLQITDVLDTPPPIGSRGTWYPYAYVAGVLGLPLTV